MENPISPAGWLLLSYTPNLETASTHPKVTGERRIRIVQTQLLLATDSRSIDFHSPLTMPARICAGVFFSFVCS